MLLTRTQFCLKVSNKLFCSLCSKNSKAIHTLSSKNMKISLNRNKDSLETNVINHGEVNANTRLKSATSSDTAYNAKLLKEYDVDEDAYETLLSLPSVQLLKYNSVWKRDLRGFPEHRLSYLCDKLKITHKLLIEHLIKYPFLLTVSYSNLRTTLEILLEHGIRPEDILSDPWVLRCKAESLIERFRIMKEAEVEKVKPWMVRCPKNVFTGFLKRESFKNELLGDLSLEEYLSRRLECTVEEIKENIVREPQLQKTSVVKMQKILDFLFSVGFTANQILTGLPRVANRRIETIHTRLIELNQIGIQPSLYVLCKSEREYQEYVNRRKSDS